MQQQIESLKLALREHPIYESIRDVASLRLFMERHVVCVWDFMSLLKGLQRDLTCVETPWIPPADSESARLINQIVLDEESDLTPDGRALSHFQLYREAMAEIGCDGAPIDRLIGGLREGLSFEGALSAASLPDEARIFTRATRRFLDQPLHARAAIFFHSREDLIPEMFTRMVEELKAKGVSCKAMLYYLERHIQTDGEEHRYLAERLLERLFANDEDRRREAMRAAIVALEARLRFWDAIMPALSQGESGDAADEDGDGPEDSPVSGSPALDLSAV